VLRIVAFWAILTLTPILIGASLSLSARLVALATEAGVGTELDALGGVIAFLMQATAFTLLFVAIPARRVRLVHALVGGMISALLFDVLKWGFGAYLASAGAYQVIYGALATIPVFLLWLYLSWMVVLIGAETAAAIPEWYAARTAPPPPTELSPGETLALGLAVLGTLWHAQQARGSATRETVQTALSGAVADVDAALSRLIDAGWVSEAADSTLLLGRDLAEVDLYALEADLGLAERITDSFRERLSGIAAASVTIERLGVVLDRVDDAKRDAMRLSVKEMIRPRAEAVARDAAAE
jgi:membrane protein